MSAASVKVEGNLLGLKALTKRLEEENREIWVGVPKGSGNAHEVTAEGAEVESTTPLSLVAAVNEFGKEEKTLEGGRISPKIPERSFLRGGLRRAADKFKELNRLSIRRVLLGDLTIKGALDLLGNVAVGEVKREFRLGDFEPNAPSTLAKKKPKTHPLENTLQLRNTITFVHSEGATK